MEEIKDMLGQKLQVGDIIVCPAGSQRYGGLRLDVGIIISRTEKRIKVLITKMIEDTGKKSTYKTTVTKGSKFLLLSPISLETTVVESLIKEANLDYGKIIRQLQRFDQIDQIIAAEDEVDWDFPL